VAGHGEQSLLQIGELFFEMSLQCHELDFAAQSLPGETPGELAGEDARATNMQNYFCCHAP
jgi:hypothetical protein